MTSLRSDGMCAESRRSWIRSLDSRQPTLKFGSRSNSLLTCRGRKEMGNAFHAYALLMPDLRPFLIVCDGKIPMNPSQAK